RGLRLPPAIPPPIEGRTRSVRPVHPRLGGLSHAPWPFLLPPLFNLHRVAFRSLRPLLIRSPNRADPGAIPDRDPQPAASAPGPWAGPTFAGSEDTPVPSPLPLLVIARARPAPQIAIGAFQGPPRQGFSFEAISK